MDDRRRGLDMVDVTVRIPDSEKGARVSGSTRPVTICHAFCHSSFDFVDTVEHDALNKEF